MSSGNRTTAAAPLLTGWQRLATIGSLVAEPRIVLGVVMLVSAFARSLWLGTPRGTLIFDENFYVNAARVILGWHVAPGHPYAGDPTGLDPNNEHPPLGKLLIAGSMRVFGDNAFGWRLPSLLTGLLAILLVYAVVRAAGGTEWLGVLAATVFAFDNLALVQSRVAMLDMPLLVLLLFGVWLWLRRWRLAAGAALGLAGLIKEAALYGLAALLLIEVGIVVADRLRARGWNLEAVRGAVSLVLGFTTVFVIGLWALDLLVTPYNTPWAHVRDILKYGFSLVRENGPANEESRPWAWLANEVQEHYLRVTEDISVNGQVTATRDVILFRAAMNPVVIGAAPLAVAYTAWRAWRFRERLSIWIVAWVAGTYLSFYPVVLIQGRTTYLFYFLMTLPAVCVAIAQLLLRSTLPRVVLWTYLLVLVIAFLDYYPFRRIPP
jgi:predicted membrane-bound dolichyl-phosphate-mannose-protein mannosyltransferase